MVLLGVGVGGLFWTLRFLRWSPFWKVLFLYWRVLKCPFRGLFLNWRSLSRMLECCFRAEVSSDVVLLGRLFPSWSFLRCCAIYRTVSELNVIQMLCSLEGCFWTECYSNAVLFGGLFLNCRFPDCCVFWRAVCELKLHWSLCLHCLGVLFLF